MKTSIHVNEYVRLPREVRDRFDDWLRAEGLIDKAIVSFELGEGEIVATVRDLKDGLRQARFPVRTVPPVEAFT